MVRLTFYSPTEITLQAAALWEAPPCLRDDLYVLTKYAKFGVATDLFINFKPTEMKAKKKKKKSLNHPRLPDGTFSMMLNVKSTACTLLYERSQLAAGRSWKKKKKNK